MLVTWLRKLVRRYQMRSNASSVLQAVGRQWMYAPWYRTPCYLNVLLTPHMNLAELERSLQYTFANYELLAEALTHVSFSQAVTRSCEYLALLGAPLLELILADLISQKQYSQPLSSHRACCHNVVYAYVCVASSLNQHVYCDWDRFGRTMLQFASRVR